MTELAYAGSFLALACVCGLAAASGAHWLMRLPVLAATPLLAVAVWWQLAQRDGWPSAGTPSAGSAFVAGVVQSPTPSSRGSIYLWVQPAGTSTPRSYRLPYSPSLEKQVARAAKAAKSGAHVGVRLAGAARHGAGHGTKGKLEFYRLPRPGSEQKAGR